MYNVRLLDQRRRRIAVIEAPVSWQYTRRPSEATDVTLTVPRERVEAELPPGVDLYAFLAPYQVAHVGVSPGTTPHRPKHTHGDIGRYVEIYRGTQHVVTGRILKVDITDETITFQCLTEEIELERYVTPAQYGRVWDGWDLADVARDMLHGWYVLRVKDQSQWGGAIEAVNVDIMTEPGVVMLAKSGGKYVAQGYIVLRFAKSDVPDFVGWDRIRWASDNGSPVRTTMQYRYGDDPNSMGDWSAEVEGALPDEIGVVPGTADAALIDIRINLYTEDTETEDANGNPVGQTPYVFAVEMIARTEGAIEAGDIPASTGDLVSGIEADGASALNVLSQACEQAGWEFWVSNGKLNIAKEMGEDRTSSVLLRAGTNMTVQTLSEGDDELVNVLVAYGPGEGINRLQVTRRHEESIAKYGEYRGVQTFEGATDLASLIDAADEYLAEHAAPVPAFRVEAQYPYGEEPEFGCGDYVRVADPRSGIITRSRIAEEQRSYSTGGLKTTLYLGLPAPNLARTVRPTPPPRPVAPPAKPEISVSPIAGGIRVVDTRAPKTKWLTTECHVSDEPNFERTAETLVENARKSRFDVLGLTPGVRYYAQLVRIDPGGNEAVSEVRSAVAGDIPEPTPDLTPPAKPTGLMAIPVVGGFVLTWDHHSPPPPLDRWILQRASSEDDYATWQTVNDEIRSAFYTDVDALSYDYQYKYRLIAVSRAGIESLPSDETTPNAPGKVSLASQVIGRLARGQLAEEIIAELDGIVQIQEDLEDLSGDVSAVVQTAQQLSQAVAQVEEGLITAQSEIQQNAEQIALRVQAIDQETGEPVQAALQVFVQDGEPYVLLDGRKVLVPGTLVADDIRSGTLRLTGSMAIEGGDGAVTFDADGLRAEKNGNTTFEIDSDGNAYFSGEISAASILSNSSLLSALTDFSWVAASNEVTAGSSWSTIPGMTLQVTVDSPTVLFIIANSGAVGVSYYEYYDTLGNLWDGWANAEVRLRVNGSVRVTTRESPYVSPMFHIENVNPGTHTIQMEWRGIWGGRVPGLRVRASYRGIYVLKLRR